MEAADDGGDSDVQIVAHHERRKKRPRPDVPQDPAPRCSVCWAGLSGGCVACGKCRRVLHVGCVVDMAKVRRFHGAAASEQRAVELANELPEYRREHCRACPLCKAGDAALSYVRL